jgi:hypothetical protein
MLRKVGWQRRPVRTWSAAPPAGRRASFRVESCRHNRRRLPLRKTPKERPKNVGLCFSALSKLPIPRSRAKTLRGLDGELCRCFEQAYLRY